MTKTLCEKYRADCFLDLKGQDLAVDLVKSFIRSFPKNKKAIILYGPPGTGKTSLVYALANETNSEIFELNASDLRNKDKLASILSPATLQSTLSGKKKLILVDELDGIVTADRGGLQELISIIKDSAYPILITANDIWDRKFSEIRRKAELVELKDLNYKIITYILTEIAKKEKIQVNEELIKSVAIKARGDVRAALNDLQTLQLVTKPSEIAERDKKGDIFNVLKRIFKEPTSRETLVIYDSINLNLDEILLWLEENIPNEYQNEELARAYDALSLADVFRGRIRRQQHWRFLVYQNILMSAGVASAKKEAKSGFTRYQKPSRILKIWMINQRNAKKKSISQKYARHVHVGTKRIMYEFKILLPILQSPQVQKELKLTDEEIEYINAS
ncbi:MAG: replication factor C large subunit [archaeon]